MELHEHKSGSAAWDRELSEARTRGNGRLKEIEADLTRLQADHDAIAFASFMRRRPAEEIQEARERIRALQEEVETIRIALNLLTVEQNKWLPHAESVRRLQEAVSAEQEIRAEVESGKIALDDRLKEELKLKADRISFLKSEADRRLKAWPGAAV